MATRPSNQIEYGKPLTDAWRLTHVEIGDELLRIVENDDRRRLDDSTQMYLVQLAQTHYLAANVRARLPKEVKTDD